jgi:uroporphyrinogen-III synthase
VLVFRGNGGRGLLGEALTARGAQVEFVTAYRRFCPDIDAGPLLARAKSGRLDVIVMSSSEGVQNFVRIVGPAGMSVLRGVPVLASHPRIAHAAREAGFADVTECFPGDAGVMGALEQMGTA